MPRSGYAPTCRKSCSGCRSASSDAIARVLILADDLTGAADCAAAFCGRARRVAVSLGPHALPRAAVVAVDLATRGRSERAARRIVRGAFGGSEARRAGILFKKVDSTLRGHIVAELAAARAVFGSHRRVIFAPAFPAQGRIVRNGHLHVNGVRQQRGIGQALAHSGVAMLDAATDAELDAIARRGLAMRPRPLFVGSAGLARALARALPRRTPRRDRIEERPIVTVVGSASRVSLRQAQQLAAHCVARSGHVLVTLESKRRSVTPDARHARMLARVVAGAAPRAHYVLTGGETARAVLQALGIKAIRMRGEVETGVPFGIAPGGALVCTKAGAFGTRDTLVRCVTRLKVEMAKR